MRIKNGFRSLSYILMGVILVLGLTAYANADESYEELNKEVIKAIDRGLEWLKMQQKTDGALHDHPGVAGVALAAFLKHPQNKYAPAKTPFIQKSIETLLKLQQPDGGIYDVNSQPALPNYTTSVVLMALSSTKDPKYQDTIKRAQAFIKGLQITDESSVYFGGIGYGSRQSVNDLSNMSFAIQALKESGSDEKEVWDKAIKFLERCQNRSETNDQSWAGNDGGFIYAPDGESKAGEHRSYASMTYAGLLTFIYANVDKDDPRVAAAVDWIKKHFTVEENHGMGKQGLYYNYHTMAKALTAYGEPMIVDAKGVSHDWYRALAEKLISEQSSEGSWVNEESRWFERDPVLVTAYSVLALSTAYRGK